MGVTVGIASVPVDRTLRTARRHSPQAHREPWGTETLTYHRGCTRGIFNSRQTGGHLCTPANTFAFTRMFQRAPCQWSLPYFILLSKKQKVLLSPSSSCITGANPTCNTTTPKEYTSPAPVGRAEAPAGASLRFSGGMYL
jgi:hypothetical protein